MDRLLQAALKTVHPRGNLRLTTAGGKTFHLRRRHRQAGRDPLHHPRRRARRAARSRAAVRRSLYGRHVRRRAGLDRRRARDRAAASAATASRRAGRGRNGCCAISSPLQQFNPPRRAQRNVAHHYDLDGQLYALFLDADRQYSCAYFETPDQSLDDAQLAKKRHLAAKLLLEPGQRVLDIGCGWGGLALYLAELSGAQRRPASRCRRSSSRLRAARAAEKRLDRTASSSACRTIAT